MNTEIIYDEKLRLYKIYLAQTNICIDACETLDKAIKRQKELNSIDM
jgi:hypothetical protein